MTGSAGRRPDPPAPAPTGGTVLDEVTLIGQLTGTVLEIGAGRGANLRHLHPDVSWVGLEPDPTARAALHREALAHGRVPRVVDGVAEAIDLPDASVDAVLGTLVLCSVDDVAQSLREVRRVLRPGGRYVFVEHVAAPAGSLLRFGQSLWSGVTRWGGCRADRESLLAIKTAGFGQVRHREYTVPGPFNVGIPFIAGVASGAT